MLVDSTRLTPYFSVKLIGILIIIAIVKLIVSLGLLGLTVVIVRVMIVFITVSVRLTPYFSVKLHGKSSLCMDVCTLGSDSM
jgi:hypothetical protein